MTLCRKSVPVVVMLVIVSIALLSSCSQETKWKGVWRADVEVLPGFKSPVEFEINEDENNGTWTGRLEIVDLMAVAPISGVTIKDSSIILDMGGGVTFDGILSENNETIRGVSKAPGEKPVTIEFVRSKYWLSAMPARLDQNGNSLTSWTYQVPIANDDGWNVAALNDEYVWKNDMTDVFQRTVKGEEFHGLDALLAAHDGKLVLEEYFHIGGKDKPHGIQSDTKSVTSLLFGIALEEGKLKGLDLPIENFFLHYIDTMKRTGWGVSVRQALMMTASLEWKENIPYSDPANDAVRMNNSKDMYHFVLSRARKKDETPGTTFSYNSGISVLLGGVLQQATSLSADEYAKKTLFNQLGITNYYWIASRGQTHTGGGLQLRPRDLLKIGQLVLDSGRWKEHQVVPASWIKESTAFCLRTSDSNPNEGYGYQWWRGSFKVSETNHPYIFASGYGGQFLWIIPNLDLVIVAMNHMTSVQKGRAIISPKEIEELILPVLANATHK